MDYNEINSMLSEIEIDNKEDISKIEVNKSTNINDIVKKPIKIDFEDEKQNNNIMEDKNRTNELLCFRDIEFKKHTDQLFNNKLENSTKQNDVDYNKKINDRMFDLNNNNNMAPIMDFYPRSSRNDNKK